MKLAKEVVQCSVNHTLHTKHYMRIVNLTEFRTLPEYTLYSKFTPDVFGDIETKYETWEFDFLCANLIDFQGSTSSDEYSRLLDSCVAGKSIDLDFEHAGRDGMFDKEQLFAIFENKDIDALIEHLKKCKH